MAEILTENVEIPMMEEVVPTPAEHVRSLQVDNINVGKVNMTNGLKTIAGGAVTMAATQFMASLLLDGVSRGIEAGKGFLADRKVKRLEKKAKKLEEQQKKLQRENFTKEVEAQAEAETSEE